MSELQTDQRRMVLVVLEATDQPEHMTFKCPRCNNPLVEVVNGQYRVISEVFDPTNTSITAVGRKCGGSLQYDRGQTGHCQYWYYFSLPGTS